LLLNSGADVNAHNQNDHWVRQRCMRRLTRINARLPSC
jgi:hypothetical protein